MKPWQKGNYIQPPKEEEEEQDNSAATVEVITAVVEPEPGPVASAFICPNCGKVFTSEKSLKVHMSRWCKPAQ